MTDLVKEFRQITKKAKLIERLSVYMEEKEQIEIKIEAIEHQIVKLDMEEAKDGLERKTTKVD